MEKELSNGWRVNHIRLVHIGPGQLLPAKEKQRTQPMVDDNALGIAYRHGMNTRR